MARSSMLKPALVLAAVCASAWPAAAPASVPAGNLLANPGAERGNQAPSRAYLSFYNPPFWTLDSLDGQHIVQTSYSADGGGQGPFPAAYTGSGTGFFAGGEGSASRSMDSVPIDLSMASAEIDGQTVDVNFGADIGGFGSETDTAVVTLGFRDANGGGLGVADTTIGPVTAAERGNATKLLRVQAPAAKVPVGARKAVVEVLFFAGTGAYHDGYVDNVTVQLADHTAAPDTVIDSGPIGYVNTPVSSFTFHSTLAGSTFACAVDDAPLGACSATGSHTTPALADGAHKFTVAATQGGRTDPFPAVQYFQVDTVSPKSTIGFAGSRDPYSGIYSGPVTVTTAASDPASGVESTRCLIAPPAAPTSYAQMKDCPFNGAGATLADSGRYTIYYASRDRADNIEPIQSAVLEIVQPTKPPPPSGGPVPDTSITAAPFSPSIDRTASFSFTSTIRNSTFECRDNSGPFVPCASPHTMSGLLTGGRTFSVRAKANGSTDPTPAIYQWIVRAPPPGTELASGKCTARPGSSTLGVASLHPRPEPADLTSGGRVSKARWWCLAASGTCPASMVCIAEGRLFVQDTVGYWAFDHPLQGAIGSCSRDPAADTSDRSACWDHASCLAVRPGVCRASGELVDVLDARQRNADGSLPFWARCSLGQLLHDRTENNSLPNNGFAFCSVTFRGQGNPLAFTSSAAYSPSKTSATFGVVSPGKGTVSGRTSILKVGKAGAKKAQAPVISPFSVKVKKAGAVYVKLKLNAAAQKVLRAGRSLSTRTTLLFVDAKGGRAKTRVVTKTIRAVRLVTTKPCPAAAKTRRARAKCFVVPKVKKTTGKR